MKLLIQNNKVVALADDVYHGPEENIFAPVDFDVSRIQEYVYDNNTLYIPEVIQEETEEQIIIQGLRDQVNSLVILVNSAYGQANLAYNTVITVANTVEGISNTLNVMIETSNTSNSNTESSNTSNDSSNTANTTGE